MTSAPSPTKILRIDEWVLLPEVMDPHGVVGVGGPLTLDRLARAYRNGIFPWPHDNELLWFCPQRRGVIFFNELKINKRFLRAYRNSGLEWKFDSKFAEVMEGCATARRRDQQSGRSDAQPPGTWITAEMKRAYLEFHRAGFAKSVEAWRDGKLVGGLYGVMMPRAASGAKPAGVFSGESVFGSESDVAKFCLYATIEWLRGLGHEWMDVQMVTPLTASFGARLIPRSDYLHLL